jgi:hypothetical protein
MPKSRVGCHSPAEEQALRPELISGGHRLDDLHVDDRRLERRGDVLYRDLFSARLGTTDVIDNCSLEA